MEPGFPWRDPRAGYGLGGGSALQVPFQGRSDGGGGGGGGGVLKRTVAEMERQQQQTALQHALLVRAVRQKTLLASPISSLSSIHLYPYSSPSSVSTSGLGAVTSFPSPLSFLASASRPAPGPQRGPSPVGFSSPPVPMTESLVRSQLQELERRLLDDDADAEASAPGSGVTDSEWGQTMEHLMSTSTPAPSTVPTAAAAVAAPQSSTLSPSPSSSSSTASSSASCSPPAPSRQLLSDTATAIAEGNLEAAVSNLAVLKRAVNPRGDTEHRLAAMMVAALSSRISPSPPPGTHPIAELCGPEQRAATNLLHEHSPCFKLGLLAANLAILDAAGDCSEIHLVDFDIGGGLQHAALINLLAERRTPSLKITAVVDPTSPFTLAAAAGIRAVRDRLMKLAEAAAVELRFSVVSLRVSDLDAAALGCEPSQSLVVNLAFVLSRIADESVSPANPRDELLRRVHALGPRVVTLVEQDMNANTAPFSARYAEACAHYGALLESLEAAAGGLESAERARVEASLGRKAANVVAREGPERVERCEVFGKWRARMGMAGFRPVPLGPAVADAVHYRLAAARPNPGFTVKEAAGGLGLGWMGRALTFASAWR